MKSVGGVSLPDEACIPLTHSMPLFESLSARSLNGSRVRARIAYGLGEPSSEGARRALMTWAPWAPVAPKTKIIFLSVDMLM